jgi:alpha-amylase/alpha-mannosidase (GH57 family)
MHQPCYREPDNRVFRLPWVRLHALKDYQDMLSVALEYPELKMTFNLVPVLVDQLQDYVSGKASDLHLEISKKPAAELTAGEKEFILHDFFMANWPNMVEPHVRYRELLGKRGRNPGKDELPSIAKRFSVQDYRDLQVWFNLCWTDPMHIRADDSLKRLFEKGGGYSEEDKLVLWEGQQKILSSIIPLYRKAWESESIEISTTPYYHPILPLVCDSDSARQSMPSAPLPGRYAYPQDAETQIVKGLEYMERTFGRRPSGMWPSEGSVSREAVELMEKSGVFWLASDEGILERSLEKPLRQGHDLAHPELLYQPYRLGGCRMFFRDRVISDKLGFDYYNWEPHKAAGDLVSRLEHSADRLGVDAGEYIVPIILDGENVWEYFPDDGHKFLHELYGRLSDSKKLRCCTFGQYLDEHKEQPSLPKLFAGSWINSDFRIWIGAEEDNSAWEQLNKARRAVKERETTTDPEKLGRAMEEIYTAEGSDWCWWYGGNFSSENLTEFDQLYRKHLMEVYKLLDMEVPQQLFSPIVRERTGKQLISEPIAFISPDIDGRITGFYEWSGSGLYDVHLNGGAMRRSQNLIKSVYFGFDAKNLFLRLDPSLAGWLQQAKKVLVRVEFLSPVRKALEFPVDGRDAPEGCQVAADRIIEIKIPFVLTEAVSGQPLSLLLTLEEDGTELEKHPEGTTMQIKVPDRDFEARHWQV